MPKPVGAGTPSPLVKQVTTTVHQSSPQLQSFSPTKFTIVRTSSGGVSTASSSSSVGAAAKPTKSPTAPDLSNTSIFDIPIVFADNDGNIHEGSPQKATEIKRVAAPNIVTIAPTISSSMLKAADPLNRLVTLQPSIKPYKVVVINKNNMKQVPANILSTVTAAKQQSAVAPTGVKYAKVVLSNPLNKTIAPPRSTTTVVPKNFTHILSGGKVEILNSTIVKHGSGTTSTAGIQQQQQQQKFQPIIINVDPSKTTTMKNFVRVGETQIRPIGTSASPMATFTGTPTTVTIRGTNMVANPPQLTAAAATTGTTQGTNTILIKTNTLSQMPNRKPAILNRNITVRKVNIVPQPTTGTVVSTTITPVGSQNLKPKAP